MDGMASRLTELLAACVAMADEAVALQLDEAGYGDVTPAQAALLDTVITAGGSATAATLAGPLGVSPQAVSKTAVELVGRGYLRSATDPADRRARRLALTARAAEYLAARDEAVAAVGRAQRRWLGERDAAELERILVALRELDDHAGTATRARPRRASVGRSG
jgi:DNA-binding MarR family transcriptional regulator